MPYHIFFYTRQPYQQNQPEASATDVSSQPRVVRLFYVMPGLYVVFISYEPPGLFF